MDAETKTCLCKKKVGHLAGVTDIVFCLFCKKLLVLTHTHRIYRWQPWVNAA